LSLTAINHTDWDQAVSDGAVVVEFWHQNCPTCKKIEKSVQEIPGKLGKARLVRLDVMASRENRRLAIDKGIIGTPTFKVYCRGKEIGEVVGEETLIDLAATLNNILKECA
jgi:thioredoxin 1